MVDQKYEISSVYKKARRSLLKCKLHLLLYWVGLGPNFSTSSGLGWVSQLMGCVELGHTRWTMDNSGIGVQNVETSPASPAVRFPVRTAHFIAFNYNECLIKCTIKVNKLKHEQTGTNRSTVRII